MTPSPDSCLIFSPGLSGHREVYVRVLAALADAHGLRVSLAADLRGVDRLSTPLLDDLAPLLGDRVIDLAGEADGGGDVTLARLRALVADSAADATILTEADDHLPALSEAALPGARRVPGRLIGIFLRSTNYLYRSPERATLRRRLSRLRRWRTDGRRFHEVLQPRRRILASALCLDEHFVALHPEGHAWLPDISTAFEIDEQGDAADPEVCRWRPVLGEFLEANRGRPVLVYLGTPQRRRGYDRLLKLATSVDGCVAHCGRPPDADDAPEERSELAAAGRLFETGEAYRSAATAALFLTAARCTVLPYRDHLGSSGVMLQSLAAGRPVLVPDEGLMAWRTRTFGLGRTCDPGDRDALAARFRRLDEEGPEPYATDLAEYVGAFSRRQVDLAVAAALGLEPSGARLPVPRGGGRP